MLSAPIQFLVVTGRERGMKFGLTSGVFDLIHLNHIRFIQDAAHNCDHLFVAVNSDRVTKILKGNDRPIVPEAERVEIVQNLKGVYAAFLFDDLDPCEVIKDIRPAVFFKGREREGTELPEANMLASVGGQMRFVGPHKDRSSTDLIARIRASI